MSVDDTDVEAKLAQLKELKSQIEKLDELFERELKAAGLTEDDLKKIDPKTIPPEFKKEAIKRPVSLQGTLRKEEKMSFNEAFLEAKLAELKELKDRLGKLDAIFDRNMEKMGLTVEDLKKLDLRNLPPDIQKSFDKTKLEVKKAGEQAARDLSLETSKSPKRSFSRSGAIKL
ncbi:MAG: hypothetical protein LBF38_10500 [Deltaproteobacteria bacterium]|nr:hypothetical protein [Deltaproteobacteria bacterium]